MLVTTQPIKKTNHINLFILLLYLPLYLISFKTCLNEDYRNTQNASKIKGFVSF
jgi:hypothetical protein